MKKNNEIINQKLRLTSSSGHSKQALPFPLSSNSPKPCFRRRTANGIKERLERLGDPHGWFRISPDLTTLASAWACDYVSRVYPEATGEEAARMLLSAEAGFTAAIELQKKGPRAWEQMLIEGKASLENLVKA